DRLRRVDRMAAGNRDSCGCANGLTALQNGAYEIERYPVERHSEESQCQNWLGTHCINVGNGVGRRDLPKIKRVIDHRHEQVVRGDDAEVLVDLPYGCIIARLDPNEELAISLRCRLSGEQLLQNRRCKLAAAAATMSETRQSE